MSQPSPYRSDLLAGKRILVTGGGTGLGKEMSLGFAAHGAHVFICGRREQVLDAACAEIRDRTGGGADYRVVNVRDPDSVDSMIEDIWSSGPLTGLVNNAAANFIAPTESLSPRGYEAIRSTVMDGSFFATLSCGKRWIANGLPGVVLSNLVTWVWTGSAYVAPSAMAKAAIQAMTMSLAVEWGPKGIRLNAIAPGPFPTENAWEKLNPIPGTSVGATQPDQVPLRRYGEMDELRNLTLLLMSDACRYINGATIAIDGGHHLAAPSTFADLSKLTATDWNEAREALRASDEKEKQGRSI
ncbi:SDR family oxidoreductase [Mesorhizobium microcysteis]|uniref:SDR family oxidoreductase n=1 Tax=Neoaquamicrobium microcysteis TaxID=2682781 RepID=A0A5D4H0I0_9HYPH|nr:SDR family oxidoreductase [Mesorhizobium microcysteis]TYR33549.1 SDR family oxidoreductase [Mesorhizobium microcysteis]